MAETQYTVADLKEARAALKAAQEKFGRYSGNNPDKYQSEIKAAARKARMIQAALKDAGEIPLTPQEELERELDSAFPDAKSKEIVEHKGRRYRRWFYPAEKSNSGKTVHEWDRGWEEA